MKEATLISFRMITKIFLVSGKIEMHGPMSCKSPVKQLVLWSFLYVIVSETFKQDGHGSDTLPHCKKCWPISSRSVPEGLLLIFGLGESS